ncbi:MAG: tetratricopeptide repeat protein [Sedimentisphaerales bacterium]|jgi:tetratricopeptide (TPR) repeat protein
MAKKRLNRKLALIGFVIFVFMAIAVIGGFLFLSRDPHKFIKDGDEAVKSALQATDKEQRKELYKEAERNYKKAYGHSKTDELKVETLYRLADVYTDTGDWRGTLGCWNQIVRLDSKDIKARYSRLKYFYIIALTTSGPVWQEVATQVSEFIEIIEKPGAASELATTDTSKWEIDALKQTGETAHKLGPYLHMVQGRAKLEIAQLGMVTNKEETLKQAVADLEIVKQLEPTNEDVYRYLAQAVAFRGEMEALKGDMDAKIRGREEAIELLKEGVKATNDGVKANITLLNMKHNFSFAEANLAPSGLQKELLAMEPEYLSLAAKFGSSAEAISALAGFYADFRLGPTYLDKAIEAIEKAIALDKNDVDYAVNAASLYSRRFNIRKQNADLNKTIEIAKNALLLPDAQETTGPRSAVARTNQMRLHTILANSYIDQILDSTKPLGESEGQQLLANTQQEVRQIEQLYGSGDNPQVIKWQGMIELATAKLGKGDAEPAIRKLYKTYTQLKASARPDSRLSYRLAKTFANGTESGAVGEFIVDALQNVIEAAQPDARLDYTELLLKAAMWKAALANLDLFEGRYGVTDESRILRIRAHIGAKEFADAERYLEQISQQDPSWRTLKMAILAIKGQQLRTILSHRDEKQQTSTVLMNVLTQKQSPEAADQRSTEQLVAEIKSNLSAFIEYIDKLPSADLNSLDVTAIASMCEDAIAAGQLDQANLIVNKLLKYQPDNPTMLYYKRLLAEPEPAKISAEKSRQIKEDVLTGIADPVRRTVSLGIFYQTNADPNKAAEQFKKLVPPPVGTGEFQADDMSRRRAGGFLFDLALEKKNWEIADKIVQTAKQENYDDCSGDFFAARVALAKEQYETALANIDSALSQRPVFGYGYLLRSRINIALGNETAALTDIHTAASTNPFDKTIARELANRLYIRNQNLGKNVSSSQLAETKGALDWAMALNPNDVQLMSFYAEYISENDPDRALALRQSLQENMPSMQNALLLARLATRLGLDSADAQRRQALLAMAASALDQAKSYDPQNPAVLESYAEYYRQTGQQDKAEKVLKETQNPQLLWRYYIKVGRYDDARKALEQSYQANPKDISTLQGLLFLAEKAGDKTAATKYGEQLLSAEETSENHLLLVQTYLNLGLVKEAEQKLASFREKYPNDGKGMLLSAWLSMKQGQLKEALELINKRLESDQSDAVAWRLRGQINGMMTDYDQAIMDLKRSKTLSDAAVTRIALAKTYLKVGRTEDATIELKSVVEDPQAPDEARGMLEQIYSRAGRKETFDDFYTKTLKQLPDSVYWYKRAAGFAGANGDFAKAEQLYGTALQKSIEQGQMDGDALGGYLRAIMAAGKMDKLFEEAGKYIDGNLAPVAYLKMAEGKMKLGDRATAVQYCKKAVDKAGNNEPMVVQMLEKTYVLLGEQETEQLCRQKLESQPESLSANLSMYNLCRLKGDYSKALEYLDKCLKTISPDQPQWLGYTMQKAEVLILAFNKTSDNKYLKDAMEVYESLLAKMPNNTSIMNNIAYILADSNQNLDKALEYARRAHEMQPDDPEYLDTYAVVLYKKGKYSEAVQSERAAIQQYDTRQASPPTEVYEHLAQAHEQLGELSQARAAYQQALEAGGENIQKPVKERINAAIERLGKDKGDEKKGQ